MRVETLSSRVGAWWALSRPRLLPFVVLLPFMGWAWAHWDRALPARALDEIVWVMVAWGALHAGTLWLNAAVDRDTGEVMLGEAVDPPPGTAAAGYLALGLAVGVAGWADPWSGLACLGSASLAVLYSHPRILLKAHPWGGPAVNVLGYGLLSPFAGWVLVGVDANPRTVVVWGLAQMGILGPYFAAQAFQQSEDTARGYRTLVATHGPRVVLQAARICTGIAFAGGLGLAVAGWIPRACLLGAAAWWSVDRWFVAWLAQPEGGNAAWAKGLARRMAYGVLLGISLAFVEYAHQSFTGQPVAGLGTAAGYPSDRPRVSPMMLRKWDRVWQSSR